MPQVARVEENTRPPARRPQPSSPSGAVVPGGQGGRGVVVGVVDTGVWPESPLFAAVPGTGRRTPGFTGACVPGEGWDTDTCSAKLVGSRWFVDGFGRDRLSSAEVLSARDVRGHGTQVASIAVGNAGVSTGLDGLPGRYAGARPGRPARRLQGLLERPRPRRRRLRHGRPRDRGRPGRAGRRRRAQPVASAARPTPVPSSGRCSAPPRPAWSSSPLPATTSAAYASPSEPWVTTVGALAGTGGAGSVTLPGGRELTGAMTVRREVRAPLVLARDVAAPGWTRDEARTCVPGSLDAARTADSIVLCERGAIGRLVKSAAVERADGVGMVLANVAPGGLAHDLHAVPTVHLGRDGGRALTRWAAVPPRRRGRPRPRPAQGGVAAGPRLVGRR